jgi:uncharacterized protein YebE (UPF0316 family)
MISLLFEGELFQWVTLPILIFLGRIVDVTLGTLRIIFLNKGMRFLAPVLGFFEILIWIVAMGQIMNQLDNWITYIAYAGGFAAGNFVGMMVEEKLSVGINILRIITKKEHKKLISALRDAGYGSTSVDAQGEFGKVNILFTVVQRKNIRDVLLIMKEHAPKAFYTIEDVRQIRSNSTLNYLPPASYRTPFTLRSTRLSK